jgi:hypothetical protein
MHTRPGLLLLVTAIVEAVTGMSLLISSGFVLALLLGVQQAPVEMLLAGRIMGAALLSIGVTIWLTRSGASHSVQRGLITGITVYTVAATVLLAYAGMVLKITGILLWPGVAFHAALSVWCFSCLAVSR